jgi:pilus assembly protein CpaE
VTRLLIIDDEKLYQKMVSHAVQSFGFDIMVASNGEQGLILANQNPPDIIICDVMMDKMNGYETVRRLRRDPRFARIPIIFLTAQMELNDKLAAFEVGGDDFINKPFEQAELIARINVHLRRSEQMATSGMENADQDGREAHIIAVHSLRGGIGCSSFAINLAAAFQKMWSRPTLLLDLVLTAGQVALMLDAPLKRTWADLSQVNPQELDWEILQSIIAKHDSGLQFIAAPTYPSEAELVTPELFTQAFPHLRSNFDYIVADLPHDFNEMALELMDAADQVVVLLAPEIASLRAAIASLDTFQKLSFPRDKICLVLNNQFERKAIPRKKIETALNRPIDLMLPYAPDLFIDSLNTGKPWILHKPEDAVSEAMLSFSHELSRPEHRNRIVPPSSAAYDPLKKIIGTLKK